jgi:malonyl-ACP decarboxylase
MIEIIATLLQMREQRLHPSRNLYEPIDPSFNWVREDMISYPFDTAISLSMGFGGISSAICFQKF